MIRITRKYVARKYRLLGNAWHVHKAYRTTVWFLFIPLWSYDKTIKNPVNEHNFHVEEEERREPVYVPHKDEKRICREEVEGPSFE